MADVTCRGACCALFPLAPPADWDETPERRYIRDMLIPLTEEEAVARYARLGYGDRLPWEPARLGPEQTLWTCRHWDEQTRLCTAYEARPRMCRDYPYTGACERDACSYAAPPDVEKSWRAYYARQAAPGWSWRGWRWDRRAGGYRHDELAAPEDGWSPGEGWTWDGEILRPILPDGARWDARRRVVVP